MKRAFWSLALVLIFGCEIPEVEAPFDLGKIEGVWSDGSDVNTYFEEWRMLNDSTLRGKGYVLSSMQFVLSELGKSASSTSFFHLNDTVFIETLEIRRRAENWYYVTHFSYNDSREIVFEAVDSSPNRIVFENEKHIFPQRIAYQTEAENTLQAEVDGQQNGDYKKLNFTFKKVASF